MPLTQVYTRILQDDSKDVKWNRAVCWADPKYRRSCPTGCALIDVLQAARDRDRSTLYEWSRDELAASTRTTHNRLCYYNPSVSRRDRRRLRPQTHVRALFLRAWCCAGAGTSYGPVSVCLSVCHSQVGVLSKRMNELSWFPGIGGILE